MKRPERPLTWLLIFLMLALIASTFILGSVPPVDRDGLTHHLFVPKLWLQHGGIYEIPEIPFSYYPMNLDLLYTLPLALGNDIIPKYIHYLFALLSGLLIYRHLNLRLGRLYGIFGALFFLSVPIIIKLAITVYVDLGLVFFTTASLLLLLHWAKLLFPSKTLILAGICCGLAAGTKYNGLVSLVTLTLLVPIIHQRWDSHKHRGNLRALLSAFIFLLTALSTFSPWLARNYFWTGNPIYPLHNSLFQQEHASTKIQKIENNEVLHSQLNNSYRKGGNAFTIRRMLYNEPWWQACLLPVRFFIEGRDDNPRYFDGKLTPFLLILPILSFIFRPPDQRQRQEQNILLWFSLLYFFFTFFQEAMRIRYIAPIVPPLTILSLYGLRGLIHQLQQFNKLRKTSSPVVYSSLACLLLLILGYNTQYLYTQYSVIKPLSYLLGKTSRDQYIATYRPEYPAIHFANQIVHSKTKVLCLFLGNRGYYMNFQPVFEQPYKASSILSKFLSENDSTQTIIDQMRQRNIHFILFRTDLTLQWLQQLTKNKRQRIAPLFGTSDQPLWSSNEYVLLSLPESS